MNSSYEGAQFNFLMHVNTGRNAQSGVLEALLVVEFNICRKEGPAV